MTKIKNIDYCRQNATQGCHGQTAENQADRSKGKPYYCKAAFSQPVISQYSKQ